MSTPDFIFQAAGHIAGWLDGLEAFALADDAFRVEGAEPQKKLPAALVYPLGEEAAPSVGGRGPAVQTVTARIGVLHIVAAPNRPAGRGKGHERTMAAVRASREAILRKRAGEGDDGPIPGARTAPAFAGGALEEIENGRIYWLDRYTVEWLLDSQGFNGP